MELSAVCDCGISWSYPLTISRELVDNYNIDVLCLTETFESYQEPVLFWAWSKLSKPQKDCYDGVAVLYKNCDNGVILVRKQDLEDEDVEVLCAKVTVSEDNFF